MWCRREAGTRRLWRVEVWVLLLLLSRRTLRKGGTLGLEWVVPRSSCWSLRKGADWRVHTGTRVALLSIVSILLLLLLLLLPVTLLLRLIGIAGVWAILLPVQFVLLKTLGEIGLDG